MKKRKILAGVLSAAMLLALAACGGTGATNSTPDNSGGSNNDGDSELTPVTLTYATYLTDGNPNEAQMGMIQEKANEILGGDYITIESYYSGTLASGTEMLDAVLSGVADIVHLQVSNFASRLPLITLTETKGMTYSSGESATWTMKEFIETMQPAELDGTTLLLCFNTGGACFYTNFPVYSMADLAGRQIRGTSADSEALSAWGAVPVTLDFSECYEGMRNNLIEGLLTATAAPGTNQFDDVGSHYTYCPLSTQSELTLISSEKLASLPQEIQDAILEAAEYVFESYETSVMPDISVDEVNQGRFLPSCEEIIFMSDASIQEMSDKVSYIVEEYAASLDEQGLDGSSALATLREIAEKNNETYPASALIDTYRSLSPDNITICE